MSKIKKRLEELEKRINRKKPADVEKREDESWGDFLIRYMEETGTTLEELVMASHEIKDGSGGEE